MANEEVLSTRDRDAANLAVAGGVGVLWFSVLVALLHVVDRDLDPVSLTISEYVLGPQSWMFTVATLGFGLGIMAIAGALAMVLPQPRPRTGLVLLTLAGITMVVVGAFPTDPIDPTDPQFVTTSGYIHGVAGILSFTLLAIAAPLLTAAAAAATNTAWLTRLAFLPLAGYLAFWATGILDNQLGGLLNNSSATGLGERVMAVAFIVWLLGIAFSVRRVGKGSGNQAEMVRNTVVSP